MQQRKLGALSVSALGLGCMGMSTTYGERDDAESTKTLHRAIELGCTFLDSSDAYGAGRNEDLLGIALKGKWDQAVIATKFGNLGKINPERPVDGRPDYVIEACEKSLSRLGCDVIDLYYQHRVDPQVPIEDTVGAMATLVEQGKSGISACQRPVSIRSAAHTQHTRSPPCRPNIRCGPATWKRKFCPRVANSGSASSAMHRSDAAF